MDAVLYSYWFKTKTSELDNLWQQKNLYLKIMELPLFNECQLSLLIKIHFVLVFSALLHWLLFVAVTLQPLPVGTIFSLVTLTSFMLYCHRGRR